MNSFRSIQAIKITRTGSYVDGVWNELETVSTFIYGSLQPAKEIDVQSLPEGRTENQNNVYRFYTSANLTALNSSANPDILTIDNIQYEVLSKEIWRNGIINHYKYLLTKRGDRG